MMNFLLPILAQVELGAPTPTKASKFVIGDPLLILGAAALIFAIGIFYIAVIRGPKQQNRRRIYKSERSSSEGSDSDSESSSDSGSENGRRRKKKRTRRREHRQRNPTLAQTGGLPPPKNPTNKAEFFG